MKKFIVIVISILSIVMMVSSPIHAVANVTEDEYADVKAYLAELGMDQFFIDRLNEQQLARYERAMNLSAESFSQITIITPPDAEPMVGDPFFPIIHPPGGSVNEYSNRYQDDWMYLYLLVTYLGNGRYLFSVDASWLDIPACLRDDSLGIVAQNIAIYNNSICGWLESSYFDLWAQEEVNNARVNYSYSEDPSHFIKAHDGYWNGAAMVFDLGLDMPGSDGMPDYSELAAHFEFEATVTNLSDIIAFEVNATYDHLATSLDLDVSFGISFGGEIPSIGFTIDIDIEDDIHRREVALSSPIIYRPD